MNIDSGIRSSVITALSEARRAFDSGRMDEVKAILGDYINEDSSPWDVFQLAGVASNALGKYDEALAYFTKATRNAFDNMQASYSWAASARVHAAQGSMSKARQALEIALKLNQALGPAWVDLAAIEIEEQKLANAENCLRRAHEIGFKSARWHEVAAQLELINNRYDAANDNFKRAYELDDKSAEALYGLATLQAIYGNKHEAGEWLEKLRQLDPYYPAYWLRAKLNEFKAQDGEYEALTARLNEIDDDNASLEERINLLFACAKASEDLGTDYSYSFTLYGKANALKWEALNFDNEKKIKEYEQEWEAISELTKKIQSLDESLLSDFPAKPIFIVGMPRSGSTLLEQILSGHSGIKTIGESGLAKMFIRQLMDFTNAGHRAANDIDYQKLVNNFRTSYFNSINRMANLANVAWFVDKSLGNFVYAGLLKAIFPEARILHISRGPMDTCLGCYRQLFSRGIEYSYDLKALSGYYRFYRKRMEGWGAVVPDSFVDIVYENLVNHPEEQIERIIGLLSLDLESGLLDFHKRKLPVNTASITQVRRPINTSGIGRWKNYSGNLKGLLDDLSEYEREHDRLIKA